MYLGRYITAFIYFHFTLTRTNVMILRKLALCVIVHPLESLPRHFPPAVALSSIASISSLAMLVYGASYIPGGLARTKARSLWDSAKAHALSPFLASHSTRKRAQVFEVLVLYSMDVTEAVERLSKASEREKKGDARRTYKPIEVLGCLLVMTIGKIYTPPAPTPPLSAFFPHSPTSSSLGGFKRGHSRQAILRTTFFSSLRLFVQVFACAGISPIFFDRVHYAIKTDL